MNTFDERFRNFPPYQQGSVLELRIILSTGKLLNGYYDNFQKMVTDALKHNGKGNIYYTLNPCKKALLARASNRLQASQKGNSAKDTEIEQRRYILIDCDAIRPAGISSTDDEKAKSRIVAENVNQYLSNKGIQSIFADSGNGYHLLIPVDMKNDDVSKNLVEAFLKTLTGKFSNEYVKIDTAVGNAARITKLYGTIACKGDNTDERPHRPSAIIKIPEISIVPDETIQAIIDELDPRADKNIKNPASDKKSPGTNKKSEFNVREWLSKNGIEILRDEGNKLVLEVCPFNAEHGVDSAILIQNSGALAFKCLHDGCSGKKWQDLRLLYEPDYKKNQKSKKAKSDIPKNGIFDMEYCEYSQKHDDYVPKGLKENLIRMLEHENITTRYNELTKSLDVEIPGKRYKQDNKDEIILQYIYNETVKYNFKKMPKDIIKSILLEVGDENSYNPVKDYLESTYNKYNPTDTTELQRLINTIQTPEYFSEELKHILIKKWLISCVKAVYSPNGISSHGVLVLQGEQGTYKTTWFKKLSPDKEWMKDGATLDPGNKDSITSVIKYWFVELGEIESTFKRDLDKLKAYITQDFDELRLPYARTNSKFPRRTVFCGSVNSEQFLKDETGSRRFWVVPVKSINIDAGINIDKVWAEVVRLEQLGEAWYLTKDEEELLKSSNKEFEVKHYVDTLIDSEFDWDNSKRYWMKAGDIFIELGKPKELDSAKIGRALKKRGFEKGKNIKPSGGYTFYAMPKKKSYDGSWNYDYALEVCGW